MRDLSCSFMLLNFICSVALAPLTNVVFSSNIKILVMVFVQGGFAMRQYIPDLMPLIVDALLDGAAVTKREVAVSTLGQVVQSTG